MVGVCEGIFSFYNLVHFLIRDGSIDNFDDGLIELQWEDLDSGSLNGFELLIYSLHLNIDEDYFSVVFLKD